MLVEKRVCDACGADILNGGCSIMGKVRGGEDLFQEGYACYGGRFCDLCESCTEKVLRMFSAK